MPNYEDLYCETRYGFKTPDPFGTRRQGYREYIWFVNQGQNLTLIIEDKEELLTIAACDVNFVLKVTQFKEDALWTAKFGTGVKETTDPHKVEVTLPIELLDRMSRGSYLYTLTRADSITGIIKEVETGNILVDYDTTAPYPQVPFNVGQKSSWA